MSVQAHNPSRDIVDGLPSEGGGGSLELSRSRRLRHAVLEQAGIFGLLLLIFFAFVLASPNFSFLSSTSIKDIFLAATELIILTVGETYILIIGEIDLSIGSTAALSSVVAAKVMLSLAQDGSGAALAVIVGLLCGLVTGGAMGLVNGLITTRAKIPSFLVTLGTLSVGLGAAELLTGGPDIAGVPPSLQSDFGDAQIVGIPDIVLVAAGVFLVAGLVLSFTRAGRRVYAIGSSREATIRAGIPVNRHLVRVFVMMGVLAGLTGFVELSRFGSTNIGGHANDPLTAIAAAAIGGVSIYGGRGKMWPTLGGVLIPVTIVTGLIVTGVTPFWQVVAVGWLIIVAVGVDVRRRARRSTRSAARGAK